MSSLSSAKPLPAVERLRELLHYNGETGILSWKQAASSKLAGSVAGGIHKGTGYLRVTVDKSTFLSHRVIWKLVTGDEPVGAIDPLNGLRGDNSLCNLRLVDKSTNHKNRKLSSTSSSGVAGVTWSKHSMKWMSRIKVNQHMKYLGIFDTFEEAVIARKLAEKELGFHENHGRN